MYGKIQDCGLTKIIPFISAIWCQYPVFCPSWTSLGLTIGSGCSPDAANHRYSSPSWVSLGLTSSHWRTTITDDCDILVYWSVQLSSVTQSCLTLCDHMDCSTPGPSVHPQLLDFTQTHVHWVGDDIQPSHALNVCIHCYFTSKLLILHLSRVATRGW